MASALFLAASSFFFFAASFLTRFYFSITDISEAALLPLLAVFFSRSALDSLFFLT
jgi:hypothetical protein